MADITHWSHANAFDDVDVSDDEGRVSGHFDTHYGTSVMAFGEAVGPVLLQASQDGEHWYTVKAAEPDADGHFAITQGDWVARYARLKAVHVDGQGEQKITATLLGKTV